MPAACEHVSDISAQAPPSTDCMECGLAGPTRLCIECGYVGCCESKNAHNTAHFDKTGHPGIRELPLHDNAWAWCYQCKAYL